MPMRKLGCCCSRMASVLLETSRSSSPIAGKQDCRGRPYLHLFRGARTKSAQDAEDEKAIAVAWERRAIPGSALGLLDPEGSRGSEDLQGCLLLW